MELHYLSRNLTGHLLAAVAGAVSCAIAAHAGDVLVFLPGVGEILRTKKLLKERHPKLRVLPLYGALPLAAQQEAI